MAEKRAIITDVAELRADGETGRITGYAAIFDSLSRDLPFGRELIRRGAFRRPLANGDDVVALRDHDMGKVLGRRRSGTLKLREDRRGLAVEIDPPDTELGRETRELVRRGDIGGMSFQFTVDDKGAGWIDGEDGEQVREIREVTRLIDVSVVTWPAYEATVAEARNYADGVAAWHRHMGGDPGRSIDILKRKLDLADAGGLD